MPLEATFGRSQHIPPGRLWFGAAGAAVAWALQGLLSFLISTQACANGRGTWGPLSQGGVRILIGCVALGFLALALAAGTVSYGNWRSLADSRRLMEAEGIGREEYMALVGVFVAAAAAVGIIWAGIPPIFVDLCNTVR